jgi:MSHA biogenesis protein MshQ
MLFDATTVAGRPFYLMKRGAGALRFTVSDNAGTIRTTTSATQNFAANTWQHVGVSWVFLAGTNQTFIQIFLNGALLTSQRYTTTGTIAALSTLNIGDNRTSGVTPSGGSPNSANGYMDEVKVYTSQINAYQADADMSCTALVDHLLIQSASTGLTCVSNPLTIVACQNAACTVNYTAGVTGTLSGVGTNMTVNWDGSTGGATGAGFATGGSGTAVKYVQVVTQGAATSGSVTFSISSPNPVPTNATLCNFGNNAPANNNCVYTVSTAGFIFSDSTTGGSYTIPPQVSGIATPTAPAANAIYLRALEASTVNPAVCTPAIISSTTDVTMGYTCNNPSACTSGSYGDINGTAIAAAGAAVSLAFDANGSAPIAVRYDDVGRITLNANKIVTPFTGSTSVTLNGNSNAFVVAPHHFGFSGITAAPIKAGNNFLATVTSLNGRATPAATPNFGMETTVEGVTLSFTKCQPTFTGTPPDTYTSSGTFSGSVGAFASGAANATDLSWSEVGNGDMVATLTSGSYLGSSLTASGNTGAGGTVCNGTGGMGSVGRFIPDHFDTIVTGPMICPPGLACPVGGLVYSGQSFTANVYARNAAGGTTQNYDGTANTTPNFAKAVTLYAWDGPGSTTTQNPPSADPGSITGTSGGIAAGSFSQGATLSPGVPGTPIYAFGTTPTNPTDVYIRATDTDSVTSLRATNPTTTSVEGGVKVVSGRIKLANAYGSELLPLSIAATAQYYNPASNWVTSSTDNATQFNTNLSGAGGNVSATIVDASHGLGLGNISVVSPGVVTFASGIRRFSLAAPGKAGSADLSIVTAPDYLLPSITGRATFGVYKGKNEFIYMREAY